MKNLNSNNLILFDFDGTLTRSDTFFGYLFFVHGKSRVAAGLLLNAPLIIGYGLKLISAEKLKQRLLSYFLKGQSREFLYKKGKAFIENIIGKNGMNSQVFEAFKEYIRKGDKVCVVSASTDAWLAPFCNRFGADLICTELKYKNEVFTGNLATPNCNHEQKALRIKEKYDLTLFKTIIAYGNSSGDKCMFALANQTHRI